jgi:hypothetical protein
LQIPFQNQSARNAGSLFLAPSQQNVHRHPLSRLLASAAGLRNAFDGEIGVITNLAAFVKVVTQELKGTVEVYGHIKKWD